MATNKVENKNTVIVHLPTPLSKDEPNFVLVGVNSKMYKIMKGEDVEVPIEVAEGLRNSEREKEKIAKRLLESTI